MKQNILTVVRCIFFCDTAPLLLKNKIKSKEKSNKRNFYKKKYLIVIDCLTALLYYCMGLIQGNDVQFQLLLGIQ